jgi:hypothetical protein
MKAFKIIFIGFLISLLCMESCGPVIVSGGYNHQTPTWFYPNRVVHLRYVYFPDYSVYYDLSLSSYIYFDNGVWTTVKVLPPRFNGVNFKHAKQIRVDNYYGDNIKEYHRNTYTNIKGRRSSNDESSTNTRRRN